MAANFYLSSHGNKHLHPRASLLQSRHEDLKYCTPLELGYIEIFTASVINRLCRKLRLKQVVIATATVYLRRFFLRNLYCEVDLLLVIAGCVYVAAKVEEMPVHVKNVANEIRDLASEMRYEGYTADNSKIAEQEFYLLEELDFNLIVYHPYRALLHLIGKNPPSTEMLQIEDTISQMAWFIINDTYRSTLCLVHPPHLIAVAALQLALALNPSPQLAAQLNPDSTGSTATPTAVSTDQTVATIANDPVAFLASLNINQTIVTEIIAEILSLYELWNAFEQHKPASTSLWTMAGGNPNLATPKEPPPASTNNKSADERVLDILERMKKDRLKK